MLIHISLYYRSAEYCKYQNRYPFILRSMWWSGVIKYNPCPNVPIHILWWLSSKAHSWGQFSVDHKMLKWYSLHSAAARIVNQQIVVTSAQQQCSITQMHHSREYDLLSWIKESFFYAPRICTYSANRGIISCKIDVPIGYLWWN